jgi:hypothetical protein
MFRHIAVLLEKAAWAQLTTQRATTLLRLAGKLALAAGRTRRYCTTLYVTVAVREGRALVTKYDTEKRTAPPPEVVANGAAAHEPEFGLPPQLSIAFVDPQGSRWQVSERASGRDVGARRDVCLIFDSGDVVRRVWAFPADWRHLDDEGLFRLSWQI